MNHGMRETVNKWWTTTGLFLLYLSFNGYSRVQSWKLSLPGFDFKDFSPHATALLVIVITLPLIYSLQKITIFYIRSSIPPYSIAESLPSAFNSNLDFSHSISKSHQYLFFFLFFIFPGITIIHLTRYFWDGCTKLENCMSPKNPILIFRNNYEYYGVTFFPFIEPLAILSISIFSIYFLLKPVIYIMRKDLRK